MNNNTSCETDLKLELATARRRLIAWRCVAIGALGLVGLGVTLAAGPGTPGAVAGSAMVQVSPNEIIDLGKLNRISRSPVGQPKTSVTFFFATESEKSNFAIFGPEAENAWIKLSERAAEKWALTAPK